MTQPYDNSTDAHIARQEEISADLLAALEAIVGLSTLKPSYVYLRSPDPSTDEPPHYLYDEAAAIEQARAAIAKAKEG